MKSDGTFTHEPSNDQTRSIVEMETLVDGKDYPSGGKWKVKETPAGKAAFLDFGSSWGEGSITPDQKRIKKHPHLMMKYISKRRKSSH